jgi:hypothetical protein
MLPLQSLLPARLLLQHLLHALHPHPAGHRTALQHKQSRQGSYIVITQTIPGNK